MSKRVLTGIKPTGELTIGNYIGAIIPLLEMQKEYDDIYLFVADLHAITVAQDPSLLNKRIREFITLYLACGVDPNKVTIYIQSENEYLPAISWVLECNTYYGEASRMIQFKEKSKGKENFTIGLLTYPTLMAADILYCDSDYVPVGIDQKQHVEIARDIAERFNNKYGETFKLPIPIIKKEGMKIKDLKDPSKKMSKSEENPNGVISMFDSREAITKKIMGATTDNDMLVKFDEENKPGISNLINIASIMDNKDIKTIEDMFVDKNYGEFKKYVAEVTANRLIEIQDKYNGLINSKYVNEILDKGINKSRLLAKEKYELIKHKLGLYFER